MRDQPQAVFLSYASQDAEAARRICEALRAAGVEVWFDQSELRGGDAWDAKIRKQIKECALFVPVISANTQARREGYFRIEWKLAAQRTHAIAEGTPFLLPVVIDETSESQALVPAEFREVQWTRWLDKNAPDALCAQVTLILENLRGDAGSRLLPVERQTASPRRAGRRRVARWTVVVALAAGCAASLTAFLWRAGWAGGHVQPQAAPSASIRTAPPVPTPPTQVEKFLAQIWAIYDKQTDATPEERALAGELGAQVVKLEPANAEAWAACSVSTWANWFYTGSVKQGHVPALRQAERAITLDQHSRSARLALANAQRHSPPTVAIAERTLRQLVEENAADQRALRLLAYVLRNRGASAPEHAPALFEEALGFLDRAAALPDGDPSALLGKANLLATLRRYREARTAAAEAVRLRNGPNAVSIYVNLMFQLDGDLKGAVAAVERAPAEFWAKEPCIAFATWLALCHRDTRRAANYLRMITSDFVDGGVSSLEGDVAVPRGVLAGLMHEMDGRPVMAQTEWRSALSVVEKRLEKDVNHAGWLYWKAWLQAAGGEAEAARGTLQRRRFATRDSLAPQPASDAMIIPIRRGIGGINELAHVYLRCGNSAAVLAGLEREAAALRALPNSAELSAMLRNRLRFEPSWDPVRTDERFVAVLRNLETMAAARDAR